MTAGQTDEGTVVLGRGQGVATLVLTRPAAMNALTWSMYRELDSHLDVLAGDDSVRAVVIRGAGERAFCAGTDISQFRGFSAEDGVAYEQRVDAFVSHLMAFPKPLIAAIQGYAVGGGLVIATACDLRYAGQSARLGVPVARTLGNCLSLRNYHALIAALGEMRAKELLFTARLLSAEEGRQIGFLTDVFPDAELFGRVDEIALRIASNAPLTVWASKEAMGRLRRAEVARLEQVPFADVISRIYGSADFHEGVEAHLEHRQPVWRGE